MSSQLPVSDPEFWKRRIATSQRTGHKHHAVFLCSDREWERIERRHREILADLIGPEDKVLDAGCGYGRLKGMLPPCGLYRGVDVSPELVEMARADHDLTMSDLWFRVGDLRSLPEEWTGYFDWAVIVSVRPMVRRNLGDDEWAKMESELRRCCKKLLYLEYDPSDPGRVE